MYSYFTKDCLEITLDRNKENNLCLHISSDFGNGRYHKQQLHACEKRLASAVEGLWKSVKSKKLQSVHVGFGECDYYDNMTDMYDTPTAFMKRGKKKAEIGAREHGSIPKDWEVHLSARILDTKAIGPVLEVIKNALGYPIFKENEKLLIAKLRPVLQRKKDYIRIGLYEE
jgi:hypothetical protein